MSGALQAVFQNQRSFAPPVYPQDVYATALYTGNNSTQVISNSINLSGKGGLVWTKNRQNYNNYLIDTVQTKNKILVSNNANAAITAFDSSYYGLTSFNSNGYTLGPDFTEELNTSVTRTFVSWTFREQSKFFDIVTYTGNSTNRTIAHNLGSVPGCIIVKCTNSAGKDWHVYHTSLGNSDYLRLNLTNASVSSATIWNATSPTSSVFSLGTSGLANDSGDTYVAYLFANNAGGFGLTGTDNAISCGSFVSDIAGLSVNLGYQPQWLMVKITADVGLGWYIVDSQRGFTLGSATSEALQANTNAAAGSIGWFTPTATGFNINAGQLSSGYTYVYIAIRTPI